MQKTFDLTVKILVILVIPFWFLIGSVRLLVTSEYMRVEYNKADFPEDLFGFSKEQRINFASENVRYLRENLPISALENQKNEGQALYNLRELSHMVDVQNVYQFFWTFWKVISAIIGLVAILSLTWRRNWRAFASALRIGGFGTAIFIALIGFLAFIGWDTWFLIFHKLFFTDGTWTFNFSDTLIRLFPQKFWVDAVFTVSGLSLIMGLLTGFLGRRLAKGTPSPLNR
ncbi:MAG: TIGR01906 family membrane protein [Bellilinea sp.]